MLKRLNLRFWGMKKAPRCGRSFLFTLLPGVEPVLGARYIIEVALNAREVLAGDAIQFRLNAIVFSGFSGFKLVEPGLLPLETLLERMSAGPARIFGLERPRIAAGVRANLVLLDLAHEWTVGEKPFRSRSGNSWLLGSRLNGEVRMTIAGGAQ